MFRYTLTVGSPEPAKILEFNVPFLVRHFSSGTLLKVIPFLKTNVSQKSEPESPAVEQNKPASQVRFLTFNSHYYYDFVV